MKSAHLKYIAALSLILFATQAFAQDYKRAIKLKASPIWGVSYKVLTGFEKGYEVAFSNTSCNTSLTGLRIYQEPVFPKLSSKWFVCYGYGTHLALNYNYKTYNPFAPFDSPQQYNRTYISGGLDGYIGLEYRFLKHPFIISADLIPYFEFFGPDYFRVSTGRLSLGMAYTF
jgi:hypothetical protein